MDFVPRVKYCNIADEDVCLCVCWPGDRERESDVHVRGRVAQQ